MATEVRQDSDGPDVDDLDEVIEEFEVAWSSGEARIEEFLPSADHPDFDSIALELLRVDMEYRWRSGIAKSIEDYRRQLPEVLTSRHALQRLAFEEYRLLIEQGKPVQRAEYARRFQITTDHWPDETSVVVKADSSAWSTATGHLSRLPDAIQSMPDVGGRFLDFELVEQLAECRFGRVYLARQAALANRHVVIKLTTSLWSESERLAKMQHTNVVPIYSVHQHEHLQAVCMPYFGRHTLASVLERLGDRSQLSGSGVVDLLGRMQGDSSPGSISRPGACSSHSSPKLLDYLSNLTFDQWCVWTVARVANGLAHAHERGILHRDLKPANVLLTDEGQPMILDFNLSEDVAADGRASLFVGGTLPYMAPESLRAMVAADRHIDSRSDIYSLGVILFRVLSGRLPFPLPQGSGAANLDLLIEERSIVAPSLRRIRSDVSPALDAIVRHCLAPKPDQRYQSARHLQEDLERHLKDYPLRHVADRAIGERVRKWFRRHPQVTSFGALGSVAAVILLVISVLLLLHGQALARLKANEVYQGFVGHARAARAPLSITPTDEETVQAALDAAQKAVQTYRVESPGWRKQDSYRLLRAADQEAVGRTLQELLYLMAGTLQRRAQRGDDPALQQQELQRALDYNRASRELLDRNVPSALVLQQAEIELALGHDDEAAKLRLAANNRQQDDPLDRYLAALQHVAARRYGEAERLLTQLRIERSQDYFVWFLLGNTQYAMRRLVDAEMSFSRCAAIWPEAPFSYFRRGVTRLHQRRFAAAERDFAEVLRLRPQRTTALVNRALARMGLGRYRDAVDDLTRAIELGRDDSLIYMQRSKAWTSLGDAERAQADMREGLRREPVDEDGWIQRALARLPKEPHLALRDLNAALRRNAKSQRALRNKAHVLADHLARHHEAIETLSRMLELNPRNPTALAGRGILQARFGRREAALQDGKEALKSDRSAQTYYQVACILAQTSTSSESDGSEAVRLLATALQIEPRRAAAAAADPNLQPIVRRDDFKKLLAAASLLNRTKSTFADE